MHNDAEVELQLQVADANDKRVIVMYVFECGGCLTREEFNYLQYLYMRVDTIRSR